MSGPFFTIGHSTRPIEEFIGLLRPNAVGCVVDVRTIPRSRTNPQYNIESLPGSLAREGIEYEHILALGGRKGRSRTVPPELNAYWENQAFHNYADYALGPEFRAGFERLLASGRDERCAIMCAEAVWWRCHRRIVTDDGDITVRFAQPTQNARLQEVGILILVDQYMVVQPSDALA